VNSPLGRGREIGDEQLVLLATRLRSRGSATAVGHTFVSLGGDVALDIEAALTAAEALGQIRSRGEERRRSLTPAGEAELAAHLAVETDDVGRADIMTAYRAFLSLNRTFLSIVAMPAGRDDRLDRLDRLKYLVGRLTPVLDALSARLGRFDGYEARFVRALLEAATDPAWIDTAAVDSVHTVWFELHEHLLATLGRDRTGER